MTRLIFKKISATVFFKINVENNIFLGSVRIEKGHNQLMQLGVESIFGESAPKGRRGKEVEVEVETRW
jgi:hypothetical protein